MSQLKRAFCDILGLRECDEPGDSISRRNFDPSLWTPQHEATDGDTWKENVEEGPSRDAGLVRDSIIHILFFSHDSDLDLYLASDSDLGSDLYFDLDLYFGSNIYLDS